MFEGLRLAALQGVGAEKTKLVCGRDFVVYPYTNHLCRELAFFQGNISESDFAKNDSAPHAPFVMLHKPQLYVRELQLLDVLPPFFRTFCQKYQYAPLLDTHHPQTPYRAQPKSAPQKRMWLDAFLNRFLNPKMIEAGAKGWQASSVPFQSIPGDALTKHPLFGPILNFCDTLDSAFGALFCEEAKKLVAFVSLHSQGAAGRSLFLWGMDALLGTLLRTLQPSLRTPLVSVGPCERKSRWCPIHHAEQMRLAQGAHQLGKGCTLGGQIRTASTVLSLVIRTPSYPTFQLLSGERLARAMRQVGEWWLFGYSLSTQTRPQRLVLQLQYTGQALPFCLRGKELSPNQSCELSPHTALVKA